MADDVKLGVKVRSLRRRAGLAQAELADRLGVSPSYLNLIEHGKRALTAPLLIKVAQIFDLDLATFSADEDARVTADLLEVFSDPLFEEHGLTGPDVREFSLHAPTIARAVRSLYEAYRASQDAVRDLSARVSEFHEVAPPGHGAVPSEEVTEAIQRHLNHFPTLEAAAEKLHREAGLGDDVTQGLVRYLQERHGVDVRVERYGDMQLALRVYDPDRRLLRLNEVLEPSSRNFQLAHLAGLLAHRDAIDELLEDEVLTTETARRLLRVALANYFAAAVMMPYEPFLAAARTHRYDIELLGRRFRSGFEQVCHRLTTLQRPGNYGLPFHFLRVDIAGNISKRFSASGIHFARFSGSCPRWNVHSAFMWPGRIRTQISTMPNGTTYFCVARTVERGGHGYHAPRTVHAVGLGTRVEHAREIVYADGLDLEGVGSPVGVTCRLCPRRDCEQRAMPPIDAPLEVDEDVRGLSFYAPARAR